MWVLNTFESCRVGAKPGWSWMLSQNNTTLYWYRSPLTNDWMFMGQAEKCWECYQFRISSIQEQMWYHLVANYTGHGQGDLALSLGSSWAGSLLAVTIFLVYVLRRPKTIILPCFQFCLNLTCRGTGLA